MKKFFALLLICVSLLASFSAFAEANTLTVTIDNIPTKVQSLAPGSLSLDKVEATGNLIPTGCYVGWLTDDPKAVKNSENNVTIDNKIYYACQDYDTLKAGAKYYYGVQVDLYSPQTVEKFTVNKSECGFVALTNVEYIGSMWMAIYPLGTVDEDGNIIPDEEEKTVDTGDNTPVMLLGTLMLLAAAGMAVSSKRRHA